MTDVLTTVFLLRMSDVIRHRRELKLSLFWKTSDKRHNRQLTNRQIRERHTHCRAGFGGRGKPHPYNANSKTGTACRAPTTEKATGLVDESKTTWDELGEDVGVEHDDYADDGGERDGVPEDEAEDGAFLADLVGGGGGDADGLGVDHFAHDAAGAVGGAHEDGAEVELLGGDFLQAAEEDVGGGVAAGEGDAEPADEAPKKGKNQPVAVKARPRTASMPE